MAATALNPSAYVVAPTSVMPANAPRVVRWSKFQGHRKDWGNQNLQKAVFKLPEKHITFTFLLEWGLFSPGCIGPTKGKHHDGLFSSLLC